jgi:diguanylate cyclase (GGDEF)-like protein
LILVNSSSIETSIDLRLTQRAQFAKVLTYGMVSVVVLHAALLAVVRVHPIAPSRICTAAVAVLAGLCAVWRAQGLPQRERYPWRWASTGVMLWALAHLVETFISQSVSASNLAVDPSDFIYFTALFPVLLALSTTRETESLRAVFILNCAQIALALLLSYVLLYRMSMPQAAAATVMGRIYGAACALLAVMALLRIFTWATEEERQCVRWLCAFLWIYLMVELGMDYATLRWGLKAGNFFDLAWSVPFVIAGWQALRLPMRGTDSGPRIQPGRGRLIVEALCPMLITAGIFALAASITGQHPGLGLSAIFLLLAIQATQSAAVQLNYLTGQNLLLEREQELRTAVSALEELSLQDSLTGIANRRRFDAALGEGWRRALRKQQPIALLMIDVDFFKAVNDLYGHATGDQYLVTLAKTLDLHARRPDDLAARVGGEEFALLLSDTDEAGAATIAKRVQEAVTLLDEVNEASPFDGRLTVSIGIAASRPMPGMERFALMDAADQALYQAKGQGRNRICMRALE